MKIFFKDTLLGTIHIGGGTGNDFPWTYGKITPTPTMHVLIKYFRWSSWHIGDYPYHPYDWDWLEEEGYQESSDYPEDDEARFRLSDNWNISQRIDLVVAWMAEKGMEEVGREILEEEGGQIGEFGEWMKCNYKGWEEELVSADDLKYYREFLDYKKWVICDDEGKELPQFSYPPDFDTETFVIAWR